MMLHKIPKGKFCSSKIKILSYTKFHKGNLCVDHLILVGIMVFTAYYIYGITALRHYGIYVIYGITALRHLRFTAFNYGYGTACRNRNYNFDSNYTCIMSISGVTRHKKQL